VEYFFNFDKLGYLTGKKPDGCILCLVAEGSEEVQNLGVYQTALSMVSLNLYPYNPGHLMVFPRRHIQDIRQLSADEQADIEALSRLCLDVLDSTHHPVAYNLGYNMGLSAGASIDHLHLHIIPRYAREIGITELLAGRRVLVQNPLDTRLLLIEAFKKLADTQDP
jgi:ATP adenylyltransferase